ncbi:HNH endonuclease domain-containing protein [Haploplasma axanthum]|uniref:Uncharacterized protein conserved in bacteria n=1 Tax=Haploplasma axanthum TaxID=29552 RepID=A0A449BC09_HAPAX|nr:HNH endonuclease domain-containing protein [Haploplasma axanthum]VEU79975.1 Uncharacterized protein conserved in bacteria [Haploplasma axanthum]
MKKNIRKIWEEKYGERNEVTDYSGRVMKKNSIGNSKCFFEPTIDHIRPLSLGGKDVIGNIVICSRLTNQEKADKFNTWNVNNRNFQAKRVKGSRDAYKIEEIV